MAGMPATPAVTGGPRKHRKTFTGCWTCRSRKVKCDEARPECYQCRSKNLRCEGYVVRLQWMPHDQSTSNLPRTKVQRSQILTESSAPSLDSLQIDGILDSIDAYETDSPARGDKNSLFIQNFGVFNPSSVLRRTSRNGDSPVLEPASSTPSSSAETSIIPNSHIDVEHLLADTTTHDTSFLLDSVDPHLYLAGDDVQLNDFDTYDITQDSVPSWFEADLNHQESGDLKSHEEGALDLFSRQNDWPAQTGAIIRNPLSSTLPEQDQFLMYHYSHHVINLFCVIDNRKSPWKTIHLPRALQSIGQLSISGSSSSIRNALRNALLSISAFYLSNESKARFCTDDASKWTRKATLLRGQAIELLKDAVNNDFKGKSKPRYKEFLATMLSMITINVMSGDTTTCGLHLDGAMRFMNQARTWKTKFSPKARALHRIYFYLRVIYESTAVNSEDTFSRAPEALTFDVPRPLQLDASDLPNLAGICQTPNALEVTEPGLQMSTYEFIYGVPQNLLMLLYKSTRLIREVTSARESNGETTIPADLSDRCDDLERTIMDWPIDLELERCCIDGMGASSDIIRQTTYAFHNALIIYFAQNIRLLGYRYLQSYVQSVLESMEAIEKVKAESNITAAPLYWPAFIAASEAFNENLQDRFKTWYDQVKVYGIEAVRSGTTVLSEVWACGPTKGADLTSRWRMVVRETNAHLMLS